MSDPTAAQRERVSGPRVRVGISTCLLGEPVRYDGGHKRDRYVTDTLSRFLELVPVCPEVEVGMGTPREPIRLVRSAGGEVRMVGRKSGTDHTASMKTWAQRRVRQLEELELCGYILKKDSPSCGMARVRVYDENGVSARTGQGLYAEVLLAHDRVLPVEEEGRLNDPRLRENFLERVFACRRLRDLFGRRWTAGEFVDFHAREQLLLLAHDPPSYQALGRLVAGARGRSRRELGEEYRRGFMEAMKKIATVRKHRNVLQHLVASFKRCLTPDEKRELDGVIDDFAGGLVPLVVPVTLIRHYVRLYDVPYLKRQVYLEPHPEELMLRNHV